MVSEISIGMIPWPYRVPAYEGVIHVVTTNKTPLGPYRAPGRFENTFAREQLLNIAAEELGVDVVELRRANLLTKRDLPHAPDLSMGGEQFVLNSGDFRGLLDKAHERVRLRGLAPRVASGCGRTGGSWGPASPTSWTRADSGCTRRPRSRSARTAARGS